MSDRIDELLSRIHRGLGVNEFCELEAAVKRLRAELAAEKERCEGIVKVYMDKAESFAVEIMLSCIIEDIRASNAAPPQPEARCSVCGSMDREHCQYLYCKLPQQNCLFPSAAPPHVEPSAAESEPGRRIGVYVRRADQLLGLHLARIMDETNHPGEWKRAVNELRALVLKTFGDGE